MPMKLDNTTVSKRYARALFELANEQHEIEPLFQELLVLRQVLQDNPDFDAVMASSSVTAAEQAQLVNTLKKPFSQTIQNFLQMLFDYRRMEDLGLIIDEFEKRYDAANGRILIKATTATPMTTAQSEALGQAFIKRFDGKTANVANTVDPEIIGGVIVQVQDRRIDGSIRTRLDQMRTLLAQPLS
ncbi:ATP synthase F1 subunit delta [Lapidilactobacillus wuchangensis]|uniref:ATP synthase F1 subunit delta n=1 Tax=Lapidilactobacillus wuchangensis TaxID=2486001 RepID=UPI000F7BA6A2|nr:ATP synthase F1 subunit delta [Lapidilactobacillus wuchangensis]